MYYRYADLWPGIAAILLAVVFQSFFWTGWASTVAEAAGYTTVVAVVAVGVVFALGFGGLLGTVFYDESEPGAVLVYLLIAMAMAGACLSASPFLMVPLVVAVGVVMAVASLGWDITAAFNRNPLPRPWIGLTGIPALLLFVAVLVYDWTSVNYAGIVLVVPLILHGAWVARAWGERTWEANTGASTA